MRKVWILMLIVGILCTALGGCAKQETEKTEETQEIVVFAASSLTEVLTRIKAEYEYSRPGIELRFQFDSSGTLKTQIAEGAKCDLFISAAPKQMDELKEYIISDSRVDLLENKVVLVVPEGNPAGITSLDDLMARLQEGTVRLAIGNSDVPVGQYTQKIFAYYGMDEAALADSGCLSYGNNAKQVTTQVAEAVVDCGIIYATDANSAGLTVVDTALLEQCGQVLYPAALVQGANMDAQLFLYYLQGDMAEEQFYQVGFTPLGGIN